MFEIKYATEPRACWYRPDGRTGPIRAGQWHCFCQDFMEFAAGPGNYPVAVVEDAETGAVYSVAVENVCFGAEPKFSK